MRFSRRAGKAASIRRTIAALAMAGLPAHAAEQSTPAPDVINAGRPGRTESAYTVGAGRLQLELEAANYTSDKETDASGTVKIAGYALSPFGLRWGIGDGVDLEATFDGFASVTETSSSGAKSTVRGLGDIYLRTKVALAETPDHAAALIAFAKLPTAAKTIGNGRVEGGLSLPVALSLAENLSLGAMVQADAVYDEVGDRYRARWASSATLAASVTPRFSAYGEFFAARATGSDAHWENTVGLGAAYILSDDVQVDSGVNLGASPRADDINVFVGVSYRW